MIYEKSAGKRSINQELSLWEKRFVKSLPAQRPSGISDIEVETRRNKSLISGK